jgi:hypothetical protein
MAPGPQNGVLWTPISCPPIQSREQKNTRAPSLDPLIDALSTKLFSFENVTKMLTLPAGSRNEDGDPPTVLESIVNRVLVELPKAIDSKTSSSEF